MFLEWPEHLIDGSVIAIASSDAYTLGVVSSRIHVYWSLVAGGRMGIGDDPRYQNGPCFDPFPFPDCSEAQKARIRELGEQLDAHRKRQQALHPKLTLTDMYNVLEKLRSGAELTAKEKKTHEEGLVSVLKQIHDDLDAAVFDAYGWPATLTDEEILERLVALNAERAAEDARGLVRWLRPEFQNPSGVGWVERSEAHAESTTDEPDEDAADQSTPVRRGRKKKALVAARPRQRVVGAGPKKAKAAKREWPKGREAQAKAVLAALRQAGEAATPEEVARRFARGQTDVVGELLAALAVLGQVRKVRGGKFVG